MSRKTKKLAAECRDLQSQKDKLYAQYDALRGQANAAFEAFKAAQQEVKNAEDAVSMRTKCQYSISPHSSPAALELVREQLAQSEAALAESKKRLALAEAEFKHLCYARSIAKQKFDEVRFQHDGAIAELHYLRTGQKSDQNADGVIRQVNMRLVSGNPEYLYNVFGNNAKVVFSMKKPKKIDVFFGPKNDRGHAVINSGGNVSYPDGGPVAYVNGLQSTLARS